MMHAKLPVVLLNAAILHTTLGVAVWLIWEGKCLAFWDLGERSLLYVAASSAGLFLWYHLLLYYWHRTMHRPALMRRFHWMHHRYTYPVWLDALYEHPVEACYGAFVMISPLFVFPFWAPAYFFFLVVVGIHEVLDHAGVSIDLPLLSTSKAHDLHHLRFDCYYGQLLPLLDAVHGTVHREPAAPRAG